MPPHTALKPDVSFDEDFWPSVYRLAPGDSHRVIQALNLFSDNPDHPNLHLKPLKGRLSQLMSLRAGRDVRVLLVKRGDTYVWLQAGPRRDIYDKAERGQFIVNPGRRFMGFVDAAAPEEERRQPLPPARGRSEASEARVFDHWATADLLAAGFSGAEITGLRSCVDEYELLGLDWPEPRLDLAIELVEVTPEQWRAGADAGAESRLRSAITEFGGLTGISPLFPSEELARIAAAPVEDWMIFLHPDQRAVVERSFDGPARVRGAAGTGKTVVALHRAAHLARKTVGDTGARILFATVTESLPRVYENLFRRLPGAADLRVDFLSIEEVARRVCQEAGDVWTRPTAAALDETFNAAFARVTLNGSPATRAAITPDYLRTEITRVVKGRGVQSLDDYLGLVRTGRGVGLTASARRRVWELATAWDGELAARGMLHPGDITLAALRHARQLADPRFRAVVVDEAQDLTMTGLQLLRALVNAGPVDVGDGLFLAGDGAQRVYPGGFTLRQAGVEVRGRTVVLRVNYRNTREIVALALDVAGRERVIDLDEEFRRGELEASAVRHGATPLLFRHADVGQEIAALVKRLAEVASSGEIHGGDVAVLWPDDDSASAWLHRLASDGVEYQRLDDYDGSPNSSVKVGTYAAAKGLEFKAVFLPDLSAARFPRHLAEESPEERDERHELELSRLFVAMTRARDLVVLSCTGEVSPVLSPALSRLEVIDG
jgi:hypothetical protein